MKRYFASITLALTAALLVINMVPAAAEVAPAPSAPTKSSSALSITPRRDLHIEPGGSVTDKLTVGNLSGTDDLNLTLKVIDFTYSDESGTPKLFIADNAPQTSWSLKPFISLPKNITIAKGQSKTIQYTVKIPANQGAGSYYGAIEYIATGANGGNVALNASGVTLVFVTIPGKVNEKMSLQKFGAYQPDKTGASGKFIFIATADEPKELAYTFKNEGNIAESPTGTIVVKSMFGKTIANIEEANKNSLLALIGQTRLFTTCIKSAERDVRFQDSNTKTTECVSSHLWPGRYTATMNMFFGQNGNETNEITATASFWYLPWWFLIALGVVILIIATAAFIGYRKLKKAQGSRFRKVKR